MIYYTHYNDTLQFEPSVIVGYESLSCPQCENMDLKIMQSLLERVQKHKNAGKPKDFVGPEGFFWRTADSLSVQDKQGTHEKLSLNKQQQQLWIILVTTQF